MPWGRVALPSASWNWPTAAPISRWLMIRQKPAESKGEVQPTLPILSTFMPEWQMRYSFPSDQDFDMAYSIFIYFGKSNA
jgi:hypothetical protein